MEAPYVPRHTNDRYDKDVMIRLLRENKGLISVVSRKMGCSPRTIDNYAKRYPEVAEALDDARREIVDLAEAKLLKAISDGEPWAIRLVLVTLGKNRGYVERVEQSGPGGLPIQHEIGPPIIREVIVNIPALPASDSSDGGTDNDPDASPTETRPGATPARVIDGDVVAVR